MTKRLLGFAIALLIAGSALGTNLTLLWDKNPEPDIATYRVYQSTGTNAFQRIGSTGTNVTFTLTNAPSGTNRFFVTAENTAALESGPSAIVAISLPSAPNNLKIILITNIINLNVSP